MMNWFVVFAIGALAAAYIAFGTAAPAYAPIAQVVFYAFLVLLGLGLAATMFAGRRA